MIRLCAHCNAGLKQGEFLCPSCLTMLNHEKHPRPLRAFVIGDTAYLYFSMYQSGGVAEKLLQTAREQNSRRAIATISHLMTNHVFVKMALKGAEGISYEPSTPIERFNKHIPLEAQLARDLANKEAIPLKRPTYLSHFIRKKKELAYLKDEVEEIPVNKYMLIPILRPRLSEINLACSDPLSRIYVAFLAPP